MHTPTSTHISIFLIAFMYCKGEFSSPLPLQSTHVKTCPQKANAGVPSQGRQIEFMRAEDILPVHGETLPCQQLLSYTHACRDWHHPSQVLKAEPGCTA